eukprot:g3437.t1
MTALLGAPWSGFLVGGAAGACMYALSSWAPRAILSWRGSPSLKEKVRGLSSDDRRIFFSYFASTAHAVVQVVGSAYVAMMSKEHLSAPVAHFDSRLVVPYGVTRMGPVFYMGVFVGYLISDHAAVGDIDSPLMAAHHLGASLAWTISVSVKSMQWYAQFLQLNELSTIFVNLRQIFKRSGYHSESLPVKAMSLATFATFGIVRIMPLPHLIWQWVRRDFAVMHAKDGAAAAWFYSGLFMFHVSMQSFWYALMIKKFLGALLGGGSSGDTESRAEDKDGKAQE